MSARLRCIPLAVEHLAEEAHHGLPGLVGFHRVVRLGRSAVEPPVGDAGEHPDAVARPASLEIAPEPGNIGQWDEVIELCEHTQHGTRELRDELGDRLLSRELPCVVPGVGAAVKYCDGRRSCALGREDQWRATAQTESGDADVVDSDKVEGPEMGEHLVQVGERLGVGGVYAGLAGFDGTTVAGEAMEHVWETGDVSVGRESLDVVEAVLHRAVALVQHQDGGTALLSFRPRNPEAHATGKGLLDNHVGSSRPAC